MENKFFEFPKTSQAISALSADIVKIISSLKAQRIDAETAKQQCQDSLKAKDHALSILQQSSEVIIGSLDNIISQLDKVLEKDGTSNNNN